MQNYTFCTEWNIEIYKYSSHFLINILQIYQSGVVKGLNDGVMQWCYYQTNCNKLG